MAGLGAGALLTIAVQVGRQFVQCNAVVTGVHFLQVVLFVEQFICQEVGAFAAAVIPRAEIQPASLFRYQIVQRRNAVVFSHSYHLLAVVLLHNGVEGTADGTVIMCQNCTAGRPVCAVVLVISHDVYIFIARIPVCGSVICITVPLPDQVVQTVLFGQGFIGEDPQFLVNSGAFLAPPEPGTGFTAAAFCFMQRTEDQRNVCVLQFLQFCCQTFQAEHIVFPFLCAFFQNLGRLKVGFLRNIGRICPVYLIADVVAGEILRYSDVPGRGCDTLIFRIGVVVDPLNDAVCSAVFAAVQRVAVQIVKAADCRIFTGGVVDVLELIFKIVGAILVNFLLSGNDVLSVDAGQILHQAVRFFGCRRIAAGGVTCGDVRQSSFFYSEIVEVGPAPAALNGNGVVTGSQLDSTQIQFFPHAFCGRCKAALSLIDTVDIQVLDLVAIGSRIAYLYRVHTSFF